MNTTPKPAPRSQLENAQNLKENWTLIARMLRTRMHLLQTSSPDSYDPDRELYNFTIPMYSVWISKRVFEEA